MRRDKIDRGIKDFIAAQTGKACGLSRSPYEGEVPVLPYTILFALPSSTDPTPTMQRRSGTMEFIYQISSIGKSTGQVGWMAAAVYEAILGDAVLDLGAGLSIMSRSLDSFGAIVPSGEALFLSPDTYRIGVQA